jgi:hypothetical protein
MNSYINLIIEVESAKERLREWVQPVPERNDVVGCGCITRPLTQSGAALAESIIWMVSCLAVILGLIKAGQSEQPLFWLAIWPFPVALACTIFIFVRQGFHFEAGVPVLGRGRVDSAFGNGLDDKSFFSDRSLR